MADVEKKLWKWIAVTLTAILILVALPSCAKKEESYQEKKKRQKEERQEQRQRAVAQNAEYRPGSTIYKNSSYYVYLFVDPTTKCHYLITGSSITPRMRYDGRQVCK